MDTNLTGPVFGGHQGSASVSQTWVISGTTSTTATRFCTIQASPEKPVIVQTQICVSTADGGTTPTINVGITGANYTDFINAASTATAATGGTFLPASNALGKYRLTSNTDVYYKQGGTPNGAGVITLILNLTSVNLNSIIY